MFGPIRRAALARFWIDDLFEAWLSRRAARLLATSSAGSIATSWTACSTSSARGRSTAGDDLRTIQTGRAQDYVYGVAVGLLVLILWMRWVLA